MMNFIIFVQLFINKLILFPNFLFFCFRDRYHSIKEKWHLIFEGWGLHIYVAKFGGGKSSSMIYDAFKIAQKYPQVTILTNLKLFNFPKHTQILRLKSPQDILKAPDNCLVLIDEIGTIFNSRDYAKSKESVPKILFQHLCQCRKRHLMIFATSQRWNFVDKQLRDIVATVRKTSMTFAHPFSRMCTVRVFDAVEYDKAFTNPLLPLTPLRAYAYVQTDKLRNSYDTAELIETMINADYISDTEILQNRGIADIEVTEISKKASRKLKKSKQIG